jgi:uncharacterized membrane protein YdjX (TVP38/TMEM64 family)
LLFHQNHSVVSSNHSILSNRGSLLYLLLLGLLPLTVSSALTYSAWRYEAAIGGFEWVQWAGFYALTSLTMAFALTPTTFIALLSGYFLGWPALIPMSIAYLAASYIGYQAASRLDQGSFLERFARGEKARNVIRNLQSGQLKVIILSRLSPVLPFAVMNVVLAMLKVDIKKFIWGGFVGMLPRTALAILAGTQTRNFRQLLENPNEGDFVQMGIIVLTVASVGGLVYVMTRMLSRATGA